MASGFENYQPPCLDFSGLNGGCLPPGLHTGWAEGCGPAAPHGRSVGEKWPQRVAQSQGRLGGRSGQQVLLPPGSGSRRVSLRSLGALGCRPAACAVSGPLGRRVRRCCLHSPHRRRGVERRQVLPVGGSVVFPRQALPHLHLRTLQVHLLARPLPCSPATAERWEGLLLSC